MMRATLIPLAALLFGVAVLLLGNGLLGSLLGIRGSIEGFSPTTIGFVMSVYSVGFILGSLYSPKLIREVGHIRTFAALASLASAAVLLHPVFVDFFVWSLSRFTAGFCFAGLYMVVESWIAERTTRENRGSVFSIYMITNLLALAISQQLLNLSDPAGYKLFVLVSVLVSIALVPIVLTRTQAPAPSLGSSMTILSVFRVTPLGVAGCLCSGLSTGSFWGIGPVYAGGIGLDVPEMAVFMSATIIGGLLFQWPIGKLSDIFDRRWVMILSAFALTGICAAAAFLSELSFVGLLMLAGLFGGIAFSLYSLGVSHTNDFLEPSQFVAASSALLLTFGVGSAVGPLAAAGAMKLVGIQGFYLFSACVGALFGLFGIYRTRVRPSLPIEETTDFVTTPPRVTSVIMEVDPRAEEEEPELDLGPQDPKD